ncbi:MAG: chitobiase/beta-hexosaminidase C-terminal domain-containing protein [Clostridiales bacterium]|jgi:hypothetical protein|nr:chitobiase/beta-hexosaminidase C-terminal domain-containing protein [Clostridiales bacterium]
MSKKRILMIMVLLLIGALPLMARSELLGAKSALTEDEYASRGSYIVLAVDMSSTMSGLSIAEAKESAIRYCDGALAGGSTSIAVVGFGADAEVASDFSDDSSVLREAIYGLEAETEAGSNIAKALEKAYELLQAAPVDSIKSVALISCGLPETGDGIEEFEYTPDDSAYYQYANAALQASLNVKDLAKLYSLGHFNSVAPEEADFAKRLMNDLQSGGYYEVADGTELLAALEGIKNGLGTPAVVSATFKYPGKSKDNSASCFYDDTYFYENAFEYNPSLASISLSLGLSAGASVEEDDYADKTGNAQDLFNSLGFANFSASAGMTEKPTADSIGAVAASKTISYEKGQYTLIALAVRGNAYEAEAADNANIGASGNHAGYEASADKVISFLDSYIKDNGITGDIKLWISGYGRGGAVANIAAGRIGDAESFAGCALAPEDTFTYTFEAPAGVLESNRKSIGNIFNIVNRNDLMTKLAPRTWSFGRHGIDVFLPSMEHTAGYKDKRSQMLLVYEGLDGAPILASEFISISPIGEDNSNMITRSAFLDEFMEMVDEEYWGGRASYAANYQDELAQVLSTFTDMSPGEMELFKSVLFARLDDEFSQIASEALGFYPNEGVLAGILNDSLDVAGVARTQDQVDYAANAVMKFLAATGREHLSQVASFVWNMSSITQAHSPEETLAWVMSMDPNFITQEPDATIPNAKDRIVRINGPVDVRVYKGGVEVGAIVGSEPQDGAVLVSVAGEEKRVYLPANAMYSIELETTGDGYLNYSVDEENPWFGISRIVTFPEEEVKAGTSATGIIPEIDSSELGQDSSPSTAVYALAVSGDVVSPAADLGGYDAFTGRHFVDIYIAGEAGLVDGGGFYSEGSIAQLEAVLFPPEATFEGWYEDGVLLSTDQIYQFKVYQDTYLEALFGPIEDDSPSPTPVPGATSTPVPGATATRAPGATATPSPSRTSTPVPGATSTPVPAATSTPRPTSTPTPYTSSDSSGFSYSGKVIYPAHPYGLTVKVASPTTNYESGEIELGSQVELLSTTRGAEIHYTLDGSEPTVNSPLYTEPFIFTADANIRAFAVRYEMLDSKKSKFSFKVVNPLGDVSDEEVLLAYAKGYIDPVDDTHFNPNSAATNRDLFEALFRLSGKPEKYSQSLEWADFRGIWKDFGGASPTDTLNRELAATMLHRYAVPNWVQMETKFSDYSEISQWALQGSQWVLSAGLLDSKGDGFSPKDTITRAELAHIIMLFEEYYYPDRVTGSSDKQVSK